MIAAHFAQTPSYLPAAALTVHIIAALAEYEAKAIAARTKAALAAAKVKERRLAG
jgi:DNA invertase Pin-like site-specific DNA recombinase